MCNMFGYCQVASAYGSGNFINVLHEHLRESREGADQPGELEGRYLRFDQDVLREGALRCATRFAQLALMFTIFTSALDVQMIGSC